MEALGDIWGTGSNPVLATKLKNMTTPSKTIKENDIVECLTADGWETGTVVKVSADNVKVFMNHVQREVEFNLEQIR